MLANRTQKWWAIGAGTSVLVLAASWFLLIGPSRSDVTDLLVQAEQLQSQTDQQQLRTAQLQAALAELPKKEAQLATIQAQLPPDADIPKTITDLEGFAGQSGVSLDQVTPGTPAVGAGIDAAAASPTSPVLVQVPISLQATGDYFEASLFVKSLQTTMTRSMLIQGVQLAKATVADPTVTDPTATATAGTSTGATTDTTSATSGRVSMTITGQMFVLLDGTSTLADVKKDAAAAAS